MAAPEVDLRGGLDAGEVEVEVLGAASAVPVAAADLGTAAGGQAQRPGACRAEPDEGAAAEPAGDVQ